MDQLVLDASVVAKLFLKEEWSGKAIGLKDRHVKNEIEIVAPSLLKYELMSALRSKGYSKNEIKDALEAIRDYGFSVIDLEDTVFDDAAELMTNYNVSSYDASYIALAKDLETHMCTADQNLLDKVPKLKFVKHLKEF